MNLFARILSHGFALILVALLAIGLVYRGDLFPGLKLPGFLAFDSGSDQHKNQLSGSPEQGQPDTTINKQATAPGEPASAPATGNEMTGSSLQYETTPDFSGNSAPVTVEAPPASAPSVNPAAGETGAGTAAQPEYETTPDFSGNRAPVAVEAPPVSAPSMNPAAGEAGTGAAAQPEVAEPPMVPVQPATAESVAGSPAEPESAGSVPTQESVPVEPAAPPQEGPVPAPAAEVSPQESGAPAGLFLPPEPAEMTAEVPPPAQAAEPEAGITPPAAIQENAGIPANESGESPVPSVTGNEPSLSGSEVAGVAAPAAAPSATQGEGTASPYQILASAREAFWLRDYVAAEQQYNKLISIDPDNPDGYGELGNMYFSQGEWDKASAAYFNAGVRLLNQGLVDDAQQLVEVIRGLNGSQADELQQKVNDAISSRQ
jgi:Tetratricopeptide repeat